MLGPKSNKAVFYMLISFVSVLFSFSLQFVSSNTLFRFVSFPFDSAWLAFLLFTVFCSIMTDLKVCSLNVRGLGEQLKRREIFNWLRAKRYSIYLLQETHSSENTNSVWSSQWGLKSLFTSSGGVAILFDNNFTFQLQRSFFLDNTGRFIICDIKTNEKLIALATIYAPNEDDPGFFGRFHDHLRDFQCDDIIIGGDFNLVLDIAIDKKGGLAKTHTKAVKVI